MAQEETHIELLRKRLSDLRKQRDEIMFEKGLSAEENKDLRENATYDYWSRKEHNVTSQILQITREISELTHKNTKKAKTATKKSTEKKVEKIKDLPKKRWL
jgi:transcription elongation GreA/GreB family factor